MEKIVEFPIICDNEIMTLFLDEESAARALKDEQFLRTLIVQHKEQAAPIMKTENDKGENNYEAAEIATNESTQKTFIWPDSSVLLLLDLYRELLENWHQNPDL